MSLQYNPPPGWQVEIVDGRPPQNFTPDPSWPPAPQGWKFWVRASGEPSSEVLEISKQADLDFGPALIDDDRALLQAMGIYKYHHPLETALEFESRLDEIRAQISEHIRAKTAIESDTKFIFENSVAKGQKLTNDLALLCLRSFNSEVENATHTMRAGSLSLAIGRIEKSRKVIERLGSAMRLRITEEYFNLRVTELELVSDYLVKKKEEKEAERDERARLREERRASQELEAERERLEKELAKFKTALSKAGPDEVDADLLEKVRQIETAIAENDYRLQNIRAGYVYVISNPGAFGDQVVKIGMTRRLEPMDRIRELGDASVPFPFEVHLLHFDADAVSLESKLHNHFADRKVNLVNLRKEYFFATASEVKSAIIEGIGVTVEFNSDIVSEQYLQSIGSWPKNIRNMR